MAPPPAQPRYARVPSMNATGGLTHFIDGLETRRAIGRDDARTCRRSRPGRAGRRRRSARISAMRLEAAQSAPSMRTALQGLQPQLHDQSSRGSPKREGRSRRPSARLSVPASRPRRRACRSARRPLPREHDAARVGQLSEPSAMTMGLRFARRAREIAAEQQCHRALSPALSVFDGSDEQAAPTSRSRRSPPCAAKMPANQNAANSIGHLAAGTRAERSAPVAPHAAPRPQGPPD